MLARRIVYALLVLVSAGAFIATESGIALFLSVILIVLPLLGLVMLFIAARRVRFECVVKDICMRGNGLEIVVRAGVSPRFLVGRAAVTMSINNTTFGKSGNTTFVFDDLSFTPRVHSYMSEDSGRIRIEIKNVKLMDLLGICSVSVKNRKECEAIVSPILYEGLNVTLAGANRYMSAGEKVDVARKGNDRSEVMHIRDYTPGDSLNSVHWKLSSKFDTLKVKEYGSTNNYRTLILVDLSRRKHNNVATDGDLNAVLDAAISLSDSFRLMGLEHYVGWMDDGVFRYVEVKDNDTFLRMTYSLMSAKVTEENAQAMFFLTSSDDVEIFSKCILVSSYAKKEELEGFGGEATAISVCNVEGELVSGDVRLINFTNDHVGGALSSITV